MEAIIRKITELSLQFHSEVISIRRHLHSNPELSFQEFETSDFICSKLDEMKIPYKRGFVRTGIVAHIEGRNPGSAVIALRADMDALPIKEENNVDYSSKNEGVMHACGHDVHTSILLGAAKILNELKTEFDGTIKMIFQPGEEVLPGGASLMIKEGALEDPKAGKIVALHVFPSMETGRAGFRKGMYMASTDELYLTVRGKGGHAAMPSQYVNPLIIASAVLLELQDVFMNNLDKLTSAPTVLAFGKITGNGATNVIPDEVKLEGTFRTMNEKWRKEAHLRMKAIADKIAKEMGGSCDLRIEHGYPFLVNDESLTGSAEQSAKEFLGSENVEQLELRMTAEDFSYYSQEIPACFFRLGTGNKSKGITSGVHTSTFDIDEDSLRTGIGLMAYIALKELRPVFK